jgi:hypothetical protein
MSGVAVIRGVTRTLAGVLNAATGVTVESDRSPADDISDQNPLIHLYLYRVKQSPFVTNSDFVRPSPRQVQSPPVGLQLFYLVTPYGAGQLEIQVTLGEIIRTFHETPIVPPPAFDADLVGTTEELRVIPESLTLDQLTELWRAFNERSFRLCVSYEASLVLIDSRVIRDVVPVEERVLQMGALR